MKYSLPLKAFYSFFLIFSLFSMPAVSATGHEGHESHHDDHREHEAHLHGHASLSIAQENNTIQVLFESPAVNLLGFEHAPSTTAEKKTLVDALDLLKKGEKIFLFSADANCIQHSVHVESALTEDLKDHNHSSSSSDESHEGHSDFTIQYQFICSQPTSLKSLSIQLFSLFPLTEEIDVQVVTEQHQLATELSAQKSIIHF